ncbi:SDR family NAD(P)-dependent oxidoreductase [Streptomyces sp. TRM 70351]|uniref:SDR family NAD(P)-dependent oxidoreductase n=1 Tax=Streptomyces sp. TRM 70351 TaxID=3116552 RepID=UPI002E7AF12E|nr:SDR family NAD(P)-dependent oxidoreductase [Streptomyces sp. TRM 70351]MEE1930831.1 SDR family NAD(P)-dependent oxidoreductase [Streptomyces sp. TRM 70351]
MNARTSPGGARQIAIVGAACRLPGGIVDLDGLWRVLEEERDLIGEAPPERFDRDRFVDLDMPRPGKSYTAAGGFLEDVASFDADYFGITPKEAARMDPQHRMLLELAVEALDDAALPSRSLAGSDTAVYVGVSDASYAALQMMQQRSVNAYTMVGGASSLAANRISHFLDLRGPSMAIDTACSSSLVALDRACRTLHEATSRMVLAAGVNVLLSPYHYVGFSQASMLSRQGRCAAFSANADGFVRAEGGGLVVLKRLEDALADGDRVHAVIVGSGSNSDGRTPGVSLPNPDAQEELLRGVYAQAGADPQDLVYLEAHGTGTLVGDPAECRAIGWALGARRSTVLPIGSVKSNLGHLEPASGVAGLFKALLVLRHGSVPATLHTRPANPDIDFTALNLAPVARATVLEPTERPLVGVNSFGFGGANAHVILAAPPAAAPVERPLGGGEGVTLRPVTVSAHSRPALAEAAARMSEHLEKADVAGFYDLAYTASMRRDLRGQRAVVLAQDPQEAARRLARLFAGEEVEKSPGEAEEKQSAQSSPSAVRADTGVFGRAVERGRVAFVFSGNGSQWTGMAADLLTHDGAFRDAVREADAALRPLLGWSVADRLTTVTAGEMAATEIAQPLLFVVQVGVTAILRRYGVTPAAVLGHSVGEVAAAHATGALSLEQAALVIAERSLAQARTAGSGRMAALAVSPERATELLAGYPGVELAAVNTAQDVTVAGPTDHVLRLAADIAAQNIACTVLELDYAFHSAAIEPLQQPLRAALEGLTPSPTQIPLYSTVTGRRADGPELDAAYWWHNVRAPVAFASAAEAVLADGADVLVEIGPHPVLRSYLRRTAAQARAEVAVVPTLRRQVCSTAALRRTVEAVMAAGADLDWSVYFPRPGRVADLPAYPWQRKRHWQGAGRDWVRTSGSGAIDHPLLGERMPGPHPAWDGAVEPTLVPWLVDHKVTGSVVMPAAGYVEMALAAGRIALDAPVEVDHLQIAAPLAVPWADAGGVRTQVAFNADDGRLTITSTDQHSREPRPHVRARVRARLGTAPDPTDVARLGERCPRRISAADHYAWLDQVGLGYGPAFQVLTELRVGKGEVLAHYDHRSSDERFTVHPALLDGALQAGVPFLLDKLLDGKTGYLPSGIARVRIWRTPSPRGLIHVRERSYTGAEACWDITVVDEDGTVSVELEGCRQRRFTHPDHVPVLYQHTEMRATPLPRTSAPASPLPSATRISAKCAERIAERRHADAPLQLEAGFALLREQYVHSVAAEAAEFLSDPAQPFTVADLVLGGLQPEFAARFEHAMSMEEWHGIAEPAGAGAWWLNAAHRARALYGEAMRHSPGLSNLFMLRVRNQRHASAVLRGAADALELLTSDGVLPALEQFYDVALMTRFYNRSAQVFVREMVRRWPADRPLRVLEVGAGTGGMTSALLPLLPADRTTYLYTDLSPYFMPRARQRFSHYDFVRYGTFDLDADPAGQELTEGSFDLVVAANALHTSKDLAAAVRRVAVLLAPGGHLLAFEVHSTDALAPFFGLLDSFWDHHTDRSLRPVSPLLPSAAWPHLLRRCGFAEVAQERQEGGPLGEGSSVLLATVPIGSRPRTAVAPDHDGQTPCTVVLACEAPGEDLLAIAVEATLTGTGKYAVRRVRASADAADWDPGLITADTEVHLVLFLADTSCDNPPELPARAARRAAILRAMAHAGRRTAPASPGWVWLVTRPSGALPAPEQPTAPADATAWGIARTLANECPDLRVRRVSLERSADRCIDARRLADELRARTEETEVALVRGGRFVPRALPLPATTRRTPHGYSLGVRSPGLSYSLAWKETEPAVPGPEEVTVAVRAAALNYRDIMITTGLLPPEVHERMPCSVPGLECAGVVSAVGDGVIGLRVGDRVYGMAPGALASHATAPAPAFHRMPDGMTFEAAATLPVAFSTVHYSLEHLARLRRGETVLVHGGAGGIGLAVLQFAALHGAHVIATAGSETKRDLLRKFGVQHVVDSRSLDFAPDIMRLTRGRGVDVVVNSLAGEAINRSLELLRPGGRFIELGKRDIMDNNPLSLRPFYDNLAFFGVDLTALAQQRDVALTLAEEVHLRVQAGDYRPLLHCVYPAARVAEAFELMQHSHHVGKVVVAFDPMDAPPLVEPAPRQVRLDPDGTYLVTGGLSGFGAATARWLADRGARHLALVSRRGHHAPEAPALLDELTRRGVHAHAHAGDVTDEDRIRVLLDDIDAGAHPLRGVVHCAMHLDDAPLDELTTERFTAVIAPKARGAAVLDRLTRERDLDLFLMVSSASADFGNIQQAPYAAGNLFLEAQVRQRRRAGLPAQAIRWGALDETGYVVNNNLAARLSAVGMEPLGLEDAFSAVDHVLTRRIPVSGVARWNWNRFRGVLSAADEARFSLLIPPAEEIDGRTQEAFMASLAALPPEEARAALQKAITQILAKTTQTDPDELDPHRRLADLGIDSLMATELLVSVRQQFDVDIPPMELLRGGSTIHDLSALLLLRLGLAAPARPRPAEDTDGPRLPSQPVPAKPPSTIASPGAPAV